MQWQQSKETTSNFWSVCKNVLQRLSVCFNSSTKSRLCLVQQFFSGTKNSKKKVKMISGVEPPWHHLCTDLALSQILRNYLSNAFQFNPSSFEISRTVNRRSPRSIFFTSSTLVLFLLVVGLPHLELSSTSSHLSLNRLCQRKTVERDKVCFL